MLTALIAIAIQESPTADVLFKMGEFTDAKAIYQQMVKDKIDVPHAVAQLGFIYELENDLPKAVATLKHALELNPKSDNVKLHLGTAYYRLNDFAKAAPLIKSLSPAAQKTRNLGYAMVDPQKLAKWKGIPYQLSGPNHTTIEMIKVDPLPVVAVTVNGKRLQMFIDTGGAELALDTGVAKKMKIPVLASAKGTFAGGMKAESHLNQFATVKIGEWTIKNVPGCSLDLAQLSAAFGTRIDGCVGSNFLMQFLSTIDFPGKKLILRKKTAANLAAFESQGADKAVIPMWLAGDHFAMAHAEINTAPRCLLFIDTGYVGGYTKLGKRILDDAAITLDKSKAEKQEGAGGAFMAYPFTMSSFTVGPIMIRDAEGTYEGPFPWENTYGFFLAGMFGNTFVSKYAVTLDYQKMRMFLR